MIVFPAHCYFFPEASSRGDSATSSSSLPVGGDLQSTNSEGHMSCECHIRLYNDYHDCTSSTNEKKWNLTCGRCTVCLHRPNACKECYLKSMQETDCGDVVLKLVKSNPSPNVTCKEKRYSLNSKTTKTGRYYKKYNNKPQQQA